MILIVKNQLRFSKKESFLEKDQYAVKYAGQSPRKFIKTLKEVKVKILFGNFSNR